MPEANANDSADAAKGGAAGRNSVKKQSIASVATTARAVQKMAQQEKPAAGGASGCIKVCTRVRPFNRRELASNESRCVYVRSNTEVVLADILEAEKSFAFDRAYDSSVEPSHENFATQETLMSELGIELKQNALGGYNSCLFAYGQTGSGKTFSVLGSPDAPGLLPRVTADVFDTLHKEDPGTYSCHVAYLEIYMEALRDLLAPPGDTTKLDVRTSPQVGVYIQNLRETPVFKREDVADLLEFGAKNRMVSATCMNDQSSRSHCIFTLEIKRKITPPEGGPVQQLRSKLNLVDLAGSERQKRTQAAGDTLKEGAAINQSLSHLANVIFKLAELAEKKGKAAGDFVPFRNSKLTMALMDSLGGNSKTIMVAALSPAEVNYDETLGTLQFAKRVKQVKTSAKQNAESEGSLMARLKAEVEQLKAQIAKGKANEEDQQQLQGVQQLVEKYGQDLESQLVIANQMEERRQEALADLGLSSRKIGESIGLDESTPQLVNISNDPSLVGCLVYFLTQGDPIAVGSTKGCKIQLNGLGMKPTMAAIHNKDNINVTIDSNEGRVLINGQLVRGEHPLRHCDRLILGHAYCFRVLIPLATDEAKEAQQAHDFEVALAEVVPEHSDSYEKCKFYVHELQDRIGPEKAQSFLQEFGKVTTLVDEANTITAEVRPCEGLRFSAEVLTDLFRYQQDEPAVVIRLKRVETGRQRLRTLMRKSRMTRIPGVEEDKRRVSKADMEEETYETVAILDLGSFEKRLTKLRGLYNDWAGNAKSDSESDEDSDEDDSDDDPFGEVEEDQETSRATKRTSRSSTFDVVETVPISIGRGRKNTDRKVSVVEPSKRSSTAARGSAQIGGIQITGRRLSKKILKEVHDIHENDHRRWTAELKSTTLKLEEERERFQQDLESREAQQKEERKRLSSLGVSKDAQILELQRQLQTANDRLQAAGITAGTGAALPAARPAVGGPGPGGAAERRLGTGRTGEELAEATRLASQLMRGLQAVREGLLTPGQPPASPRRVAWMS